MLLRERGPSKVPGLSPLLDIGFGVFATLLVVFELSSSSLLTNDVRVRTTFARWRLVCGNVVPRFWSFCSLDLAVPKRPIDFTALSLVKGLTPPCSTAVVTTVVFL
jgi:hypothetical protein